MRKLIFGQDAELCAWTGNLVGLPNITGATIGISDGEKIIAAVVYNGYTGRDIQATMASITPKWATRGVLRAIFFYPFIQLGCCRVTCATEVTNQPVRAFLCHLGFSQEGVLREWFSTGDAAIYSLLKSECKWIRGLENAVVSRQAA